MGIAFTVVSQIFKNLSTIREPNSLSKHRPIKRHVCELHIRRNFVNILLIKNKNKA